MMGSLFQSIFGCAHSRTTFPLTPKRQAAGPLPVTYVTCLDCGRELGYNWNEMKIDPSIIRPIPQHVPVVPEEVSRPLLRRLRFG
jgi:hypothetical protein